MITIVDYGLGNLGSVLNMLKRIGVKGEVKSDLKSIENASKLILPGVGAFDTAMKNLNESNLTSVLKIKALEEKTPIMGICLGMQILMNSSEEGSKVGLGLIDGEVKKFSYDDSQLKIPHMGWNYVYKSRNDVPLINGLGDSKFYFVHSYYVKVKDKTNSLLTTNYGIEFDSGVIKDNIYGFQFHPEKSHKFGMKLFENFSEL
jgi:imidazole glycerol-phosphate synthase subunit HisH